MRVNALNYNQAMTFKGDNQWTQDPTASREVDTRQGINDIVDMAGDRITKIAEKNDNKEGFKNKTIKWGGAAVMLAGAIVAAPLFATKFFTTGFGSKILNFPGINTVKTTINSGIVAGYNFMRKHASKVIANLENSKSAIKTNIAKDARKAFGLLHKVLSDSQTAQIVDTQARNLAYASKAFWGTVTTGIGAWSGLQLTKNYLHLYDEDPKAAISKVVETAKTAANAVAIASI